MTNGSLFFASFLLILSSLVSSNNVVFRDQSLMASEVNSSTLVLNFPIIWYTNALPSMSDSHPKNLQQKLNKRALQWPGIFTGCLGAIQGGISGAITKFGDPIGMLQQGTSGAIYGYQQGYQNGQIFTRIFQRRSLTDVDSMACNFLKQIFVKSDRDNDGRLSSNEFGTISGNMTMELLEKMDLDNSTFIEPNEFNECLSSRRMKRCNGCNENCYQPSNTYTIRISQTGYYVPATNTIYVSY